MIKLFHKQQVPELDIETASRILAYAFEVNQAQPNTIPLDVLASYSSYRKERFALQRTILAVIMGLFVLIPFLFIPPAFSLAVEKEFHGMNPIYRLKLDSFMLVDRLTVQIDGRNIPVYEVDSHVYSIEPSANGQMAITATLINRQTLTEYVEVTNVDKDSPYIVTHWMKNGRLHIQLADDGTGVNYGMIRGVTQNQQEVPPDEIDEEASCVVFGEPMELTNIFFPDNADNTLQVIVAVEK